MVGGADAAVLEEEEEEEDEEEEEEDDMKVFQKCAAAASNLLPTSFQRSIKTILVLARTGLEHSKAHVLI